MRYTTLTWNDIQDKKPPHDGEYLVITYTGSITELRYYKDADVFNCVEHPIKCTHWAIHPSTLLDLKEDAWRRRNE
jgi:hypothetical protein